MRKPLYFDSTGEPDEHFVLRFKRQFDDIVYTCMRNNEIYELQLRKTLIITVDFLHLWSKKDGNSNISLEGLQKINPYNYCRFWRGNFCNTASGILRFVLNTLQKRGNFVF